MRRHKYPTEKRGDYLDLTTAGHDIWMRENNPDGWDTETWRAFVERVSASPEFKARCQEAKRRGWKCPHPTEDGWRPTGKFDPLAAIGKG